MAGRRKTSKRYVMENPNVKIVVCGAAGRMGRRIISLATENEKLTVVGALEHKGNALIGTDSGLLACNETNGVLITDDFDLACKDADAVIDFTSVEATLEHARTLPAGVKAFVVGTTGLKSDQIEELKKSLQGRVCVFSPNMSIGVNLLFSLVRKAAAALRDKYDVEIVERHHNMKKDAPSGTAVKFGQVVADAQGLGTYEERAVHGREGMCPHRKNDIGMHAVRAGDIIGEHSVIFAGCAEVIEFKHLALSRDAFANGALAAAVFGAGVEPGWYSMEDVFAIF